MVDKRYYTDKEFRRKVLDKQLEYYYSNWEERRSKANNYYHTSYKKRKAELQKISQPIYRMKLKIEVLTHYGNGRLACVCCGENIIDFLSLDHIKKKPKKINGVRRKYGYELLSYLKVRGYPIGYQTMCFNCNFGKYLNKGICSHKIIDITKKEDHSHPELKEETNQ